MLVHFLREKGEFGAAESILDESLSRVLKAHGEKHAELTRRMRDLGLSILAYGVYDDKDLLWSQIAELQRRNVPQGGPGIAGSVDS